MESAMKSLKTSPSAFSSFTALSNSRPAVAMYMHTWVMPLRYEQMMPSGANVTPPATICRGEIFSASSMRQVYRILAAGTSLSTRDSTVLRISPSGSASL